MSENATQAWITLRDEFSLDADQLRDLKRVGLVKLDDIRHLTHEDIKENLDSWNLIQKKKLLEKIDFLKCVDAKTHASKEQLKCMYQLEQISKPAYEKALADLFELAIPEVCYFLFFMSGVSHFPFFVLDCE